MKKVEIKKKKQQYMGIFENSNSKQVIMKKEGKRD
jgi:hypothetical protein